MIISTKTKTAFIHIPKTGGSTIRRQLRHLHDIDRDFSKPGDLPGIGRVHMAHLSLDTLRVHFPEVYAVLLDCETFAICRDPFARFRSAASQHFKEFEEISMSMLKADEMRSKLFALIAEIERSPDQLPLRLTHFSTQSEMLCCGGQDIKARIFALEDLSVMTQELSVRTGVTLDVGTKNNETILLRDERLRKPLVRTATALSRILPPGMYRGLQQAAKKTLRKPVPETVGRVFETPEIAEFIRRYYAQDINLYQSVRSRQADRTLSLD